MPDRKFNTTLYTKAWLRGSRKTLFVTLCKIARMYNWNSLNNRMTVRLQQFVRYCNKCILVKRQEAVTKSLPIAVVVHFVASFWEGGVCWFIFIFIFFVVTCHRVDLPVFPSVGFSVSLFVSDFGDRKAWGWVLFPVNRWARLLPQICFLFCLIFVFFVFGDRKAWELTGYCLRSVLAVEVPKASDPTNHHSSEFWAGEAQFDTLSITNGYWHFEIGCPQPKRVKTSLIKKYFSSWQPGHCLYGAPCWKAWLWSCVFFVFGRTECQQKDWIFFRVAITSATLTSKYWFYVKLFVGVKKIDFVYYRCEVFQKYVF